jgi:hypothetical protein
MKLRDTPRNEAAWVMFKALSSTAFIVAPCCVPTHDVVGRHLRAKGNEILEGRPKMTEFTRVSSFRFGNEIIFVSPFFPPL